MWAIPAGFAAWVTVLARMNTAIAMRAALCCGNAARPKARGDQHHCRKGEYTALPCRRYSNPRIHDDTPSSVPRMITFYIPSQRETEAAAAELEARG